MKICGIVCEFNPLHNGHAYLLAQARARSGCDALVCVMSGNFTQRGEPACMEKYTRAEHAILAGADAVIDTSCEDLRTRVAELTNGRGVDVVLDNIGLEWSINEGVYMVRPGGKVLVCGYISEDFKVNYQEVMKFEKEILGMRGMTRQDMAEVVELVNQRKIVPYVYKTVPFEQINEALGLLRDGKTKGRVVLLFPED